MFHHDLPGNLPLHLYSLPNPVPQPQETSYTRHDPTQDTGIAPNTSQRTWDTSFWPPIPWGLSTLPTTTTATPQAQVDGARLYPYVAGADARQSPPRHILQQPVSKGNAHHDPSLGAFDLANFGDLHRPQPSPSPAPAPAANYLDRYLPEHLQLPWVIASPPVKIVAPAPVRTEYGDRYQQLLQTKLSDSPVAPSTSFLGPGPGGEPCAFGQVATNAPVTDMNVGERFDELLKRKLGSYISDPSASTSGASGQREQARERYKTHANLRRNALEDGCGMMSSGSVPTVVLRGSLAGLGQDIGLGPDVGAGSRKGKERAWTYDDNTISPPLSRPVSHSPTPDFANPQAWSDRLPARSAPTTGMDAGYLETLFSDYLPRPLTQQETNQAYPQSFSVPPSTSYEQTQSLDVPLEKSIGFSLYGNHGGQSSSNWDMAAAADDNTERRASFSISPPSPAHPSVRFSYTPTHHSPPPAPSRPLSSLDTTTKEASTSWQAPSPDTPPVLKIKVHKRNVLPPSAHELEDADIYPVIRLIPSSFPPLHGGGDGCFRPSFGDGEGDGGKGDEEGEGMGMETGMRREPIVKKRERSSKGKRKASSLVGDTESQSESEEGEGFIRKGKNGRKIYAKTSIACNYCRVKKLKCDGVRPICCHCAKRESTDCVFSATLRRRGPAKTGRRRGAQKTAFVREEMSFPGDDEEAGRGGRMGVNVSMLRDDPPLGGRGAIAGSRGSKKRGGTGGEQEREDARDTGEYVPQRRRSSRIGEDEQDGDQEEGEDGEEEEEEDEVEDAGRAKERWNENSDEASLGLRAIPS
ncbi:hypothetical protein B9479_004291 [Cryptococcus floricola]|uniref:Zn(2)-C6 fungal-type domain-containing protein n=1 Tax=Cryptococcus floricola TaxID=2591691 RepID=A0A5D3AUC0_9TREE|nr:hypothetical protein B9479_004291 [Cryptococcus floricola]